MGNLLRILYNRENDSPSRLDIFVDFENATPTEGEQKVWEEVEIVLKESQNILKDLAEYKGAAPEIKEAISHPSNVESQDKAWNAVVPLVSRLKHYFEYSSVLEKTIPHLFNVLCSNEMSPRKHLESQQSLFKQFAEILDFTLKFDDLKMTNPALQNDFSYFRRTLSRMKLSGNDDDHTGLEISDSLANRMSLFYAHATPMLKILSDTTSKFVSERKDLPIENTTDCLSTMANICRVTIDNPKYRVRISNEETIMFCLRVMIGVIILYDHVHPVGAFIKTSNIDIKNSIRVLKEHAPQTNECLLNALRYTTKHLNDESTPKPIRALLL